jgi:hypothetical protein
MNLSRYARIAYVNESSHNLTVPTELLPVIVDEPFLAPAPPLPSDRHPAFVYLARLAPGSRRTMAQALRVIASLFGQTPVTMPWAALLGAREN